MFKVNDLVQELISGIEEGRILPTALLSSLDVDAYLDASDADEVWSKQWNDAYSQISDVPNDEIVGYEKLDQLVFSKCTEHFGISDMSCYTTEDFELLCKSAKKGITSEWLDELRQIYLSGSIPLAP